MTGLYDAPQRSSHSQVTHEIRHGFAKILHDALPELQRLDIRPSNLRPELGQWYSDEFASGMVNFLFGGHSGLPMWLAIIAHCYRNIHDILRGHMSCAAQANAADCPNLNLQGRYSTPKEITYTPSQLLVAMKDRLIKDEPVRHFEMIGFSQQCSTFLTEARQRTGVFMEAPQKPKTLHSPHDLTNVVLVEAAGALEAGIPASKTLLSTVSKALQDTIANSGDKYTKATYARSSGHLSFIEKPMINLMRFPSTAETRFTTFVRECLKKKPENWMVEDDTRGAAIYQVDGDPENFARLVKVYSVLKIWDQQRWANMAAQSLQSSKVGRYDEALVEGMRSWVQAGFHEDTVPAVLAMLLAVNCERATDKASEKRVRELMVRLFRSS
jgi:hypothetical protein